MSNITVTVDGITKVCSTGAEAAAEINTAINLGLIVSASVDYKVTYKVYANTGEGSANMCFECAEVYDIPMKYFGDRLYTVVRAITIKGLVYRHAIN